MRGVDGDGMIPLISLGEKPEARMARHGVDLLQGTLDMLILKALTPGARHGYAVMRWIREVSEEELQIEEGALYPALHRLEGKGWIRSEWGRSENNRQAKFYVVTPAGQRARREQEASWTRYVRVIGKVLSAG